MTHDDLSDKARKIETGGGDYQESGQSQRLEVSLPAADDTGRIERSAERAGRVAERLDHQSYEIAALRSDVREVNATLSELVMQGREDAIKTQANDVQTDRCYRTLFGNGKWGLVNLCRFSRVALTLYFIVLIIFVLIVLSGYTAIMEQIDELRSQVEVLLGGI